MDINTLFDHESYKTAKELEGFDTVEELERAYKDILSIYKELEPCTNFNFLDDSKINELIEKGGDPSFFWFDFNLLLILCIRSSALSVLKIIELISLSLKSNNELLLAFSFRSFIEHSCTIGDLANSIEPYSSELIEKILANNSFSNLLPTESYMEVRKDLLRFSHGHRVQLIKEIPAPSDSGKIWENYLKLLKDIPDELKPKHVMTCVDRISRKFRIRILRTVYELLSEYVHPNSASRTFTFLKSAIGGTYSYQESNLKLTKGFRNIFNLGNEVIVSMINIVKLSFDTLNKCRMPMTLHSGSKEYRPGYVPAIDDYGRKFWIESEKIVPGKKTGIPLTDEQKNRIHGIYTVFCEIDPRPLENWIETLQKGPNPEKEIQIYEHLVKIYKNELQNRFGGYDLRNNLYFIIVKASLGYSATEIMIDNPELRHFPYLDRVIDGVKKGSK